MTSSSPTPASPRAPLASALWTYGGGALLVAAVALAMFVRARNLTARAEVDDRARQAAELLARRAGEVGADAALAALRDAPGVLSAFVLGDSDASSRRYGYLKRRQYVAHTDAARRGQPVEDKTLHDATTATLTRGRPAIRRASMTSPGGGRAGAELPVVLAVAAVPAAGAGAPALAAGVLVSPEGRPRPLPGAFWVLLLGGVLASAAAGRLAPRARHAVAGLATVALAVVAYTTMLRPFGPVATRLGLPLLAAAAAAGVAFAALGAAGLGARFFAGLHDHRHAIGYVSPALLGLGVLVLVPFVVGVGMAFFDHRHGAYTFVGLKNFVEVLSGGGHTLGDPLNFYFILGVTILWTAVNVFLHTGIGLAVALVLNQPTLGLRGMYRVLLVLPWAVPNYITALIWKGMFHQQYGAVNHVLGFFGVEPVSWFSAFWTAMTANIVTNAWLGFPFMMVISLGALQSIPSDIYEAAEVDGATRWQRFTRLTLPLLRPALFPAIILGCVWTFNQFNIIYLVSKGEPGGKTNILVTEAYRWAFERGERYGLAAAYAVIIFVILLGYSWITNRVSRASEGAYS